MGVGVSCPKCHTTFAFYCNKCSSYNTEIYKGYEPENYFLSRTAFYLKCRQCKFEYDYAICPDCHTKIFPTAPFVKGDSGEGNAKGCFIATACLDDNSRILNQLYLLRDELLEKNKAGRKLIKYYYIYSPAVASCIQKSFLLKSSAKFLIVYPAYLASLLAMKIISFLKKQSTI
jgi:hypothetical protein